MTKMKKTTEMLRKKIAAMKMEMNDNDEHDNGDQNQNKWNLTDSPDIARLKTRTTDTI